MSVARSEARKGDQVEPSWWSDARVLHLEGSSLALIGRTLKKSEGSVRYALFPEKRTKDTRGYRNRKIDKEAVREALAKRRSEIGRSHSADWNEANPEKRRAQKRVENALLSGILVRQPCERCATTIRVQAHHEDYSKPLEIMWLCSRHHKQRHREMNCEKS